jgi:SAM-dependent methyltransferase
VSAAAGPADPGASPPSPFLSASRALLTEAAARGPVLDLACGRGRNALAAAAWGVPVLGLDRNAAFLAELLEAARGRDLPLSALRCDLESGWGIPVRPGSCAAILVFRFLFRPLAPAIEEALAPGGLLLYETFTRGQRALGHGPRRDAFLLAPGELPALFPGLRVLSSWEGVEERGPKPEAVARLAARRPGS